MSLTLLAAADRVAKPWKNGGGVTSDVLVVPAGAGLDDFAARISIAEVAASGPFSAFPGIDRTTAILAGDGFALSVDGVGHRLGRGDAPLAYPGDVPAAAVLLGGPTTDLNVMTRRGVRRHRVARLALPAGTRADLAAGDRVTLWLAGTGTIADAAAALAPGPRDAVVSDAAVTVTATTDVDAFAILFF
jgi:environmental stress-induced protein Ves